MKNTQFWLVRLTRQSTIIVNQPIVEAMERIVANIKHGMAKARVAHKDLLLKRAKTYGIGQILITEELRMIACQTKQVREQGLRRPRAVHAYAMGGHDRLEGFTCNIPRTHHVGEYRQSSGIIHSLLTRRSQLVITIQRGMSLIATLTNNKDNMGPGRKARRHHRFVQRLRKIATDGSLLDILRNLISQAIDGQIVFRLGLKVLHSLHVQFVETTYYTIKDILATIDCGKKSYKEKATYGNGTDGLA